MSFRQRAQRHSLADIEVVHNLSGASIVGACRVAAWLRLLRVSGLAPAHPLQWFWGIECASKSSHAPPHGRQLQLLLAAIAALGGGAGSRSSIHSGSCGETNVGWPSTAGPRLA